MQTFIHHLSWIVACATAVSCLAALGSRDADWMRTAVVFSFTNVALVLRLNFWGVLPALQPRPAPAVRLDSDTTEGGQGILHYLGWIVEAVWPHRVSASQTSRFFVHLTWIVAAATVMSWLVAAVTGDDEWVLAAVGLSFGTFVLVTSTAFPGRFTAGQRFIAVITIVVGVVVIGLLVLSAALSGWPK